VPIAQEPRAIKGAQVEKVWLRIGFSWANALKGDCSSYRPRFFSHRLGLIRFAGVFQNIGEIFKPSSHIRMGIAKEFPARSQDFPKHVLSAFQISPSPQHQGQLIQTVQYG
jgi:hypothetical protein